MDSASKAIIIAGGFLVGILIISISMYMFTSFREVYEESMDQFEIRQIVAFNSFFTQYKSPIKGYDVYNIIGKISEINADTENNYFISFNDNSENITRKGTFYFTENFGADYDYKYYYDADGVIYKIDIKEHIEVPEG